MTVISNPVPLFANLPINADFYQPSRFVISGVNLGVTTIVTTTEDHNYVLGQECRLYIPPSFGCRQLNQRTGFVLSIPAADQVELNIYSLGGDEYIASDATTVAQILAIGDINTGSTNGSGRTSNATTIPGAFIDVSP